MDQIKVTANSLVATKTALKNMAEGISNAIAICKSEVKDQFGGIDDDYRNHLNELIESLTQFSAELNQFEEKNRKALDERINVMEQYAASSYRKRY